MKVYDRLLSEHIRRLQQRHLAFLILVICIALTACHSSRRTVTGADRQEWHTLEVPVKVSIDKPMSMSLSGRATLVRDSSVYISMRMLGMEVAYAIATGDSITFCDRYHKQYVSEPLDKLLPDGYADIGKLQLIMLGCYVPQQLSGYISLSDPVSTPLGEAHQTMSVKGTLDKTSIETTLTYQFDKAEWDVPARPMPKLPRNARHIQLDMLLKILRANDQ